MKGNSVEAYRPDKMTIKVVATSFPHTHWTHAVAPLHVDFHGGRCPVELVV
jgi:hypothetical protein